MGLVFKDLFLAAKKGKGKMNFEVIGKQTVWVCLRRESATRYHLQGIFADTDSSKGEDIAAACCLDETYYIAPMPLNVALPEAVVEWKGAYCPNPTPRRASH